MARDDLALVEDRVVAEQLADHGRRARARGGTEYRLPPMLTRMSIATTSASVAVRDLAVHAAVVEAMAQEVSA